MLVLWVVIFSSISASFWIATLSGGAYLLTLALIRN